MPLPVIADHFLVQAVFQRSGNDPVGNTFTFRNDDVPSSSIDMVAVRDWLDSVYGTGGNPAGFWGKYLSERLHSLNYVVYDLGKPNDGAREIPSATFRTSSTGTASMPPDVSLVISWKTAKRGKSFRGRTYLGPLHHAINALDGVPENTAVNELRDASRKFIGNPATRKFTPVVLSRTLGETNVITSGYIDREYDTQRRRGVKSAARTIILPATTV